MGFDGGKLGDNYGDKIYEQYKSKVNEFKKIFIALLLASSVFTFAFLIPYISIIIKGHSLNQELERIDDNQDYKKFIKTMDEVTNGITNLKNSLTSVRIDLTNAINNLNLFQIQLQIQQTSKAIDNVINNENISENDKNFQGLYSLTKNFSSNFVINAPFQNKIERKCTEYDSMKKQLCIWKEVIDNSSENHVNIDYSLLKSPTCNLAYPTYMSDIFVSNTWADCILNEIVNNHITIFSDDYIKSISIPLQNLDKNKVANNITMVDEIKQREIEIKNKIQIINQTKLNFFNNATLRDQLQEKTNDLDLGTNFYLLSSFQLLGPGIENLTSQISLIFENLDKNKISKDISEVIKQIDDTKLRLSQTQFPFASFPLELNSTIGLFPVALTIGFAICMSIAYSALELRKTLRDWNKKIGSQKTFNDKHLS
ncbi:MAG: hypothetical protein H0X03_08660, partial [Nitrosopumilus sp.]|nr:hypothetical protein [Nitrosopumilus sp.]